MLWQTGRQTARQTDDRDLTICHPINSRNTRIVPFSSVNNSNLPKGAFWCICSRRLLEILWQTEKFLIMSNLSICQQNVQLYQIIIFSYIKSVYILASCLLQFFTMCERVKAFNYFPHIHIDAFCHLCSRRLFENIVTKEEFAQNEQFLLLP